MDESQQPSFWSERTENVSAFHKASADRERRADSGVLLVLACGFGANPTSAWQEVLPRLMRAAPECDVLSYSPGVLTHDHSALEASAQHLGEALGPRAAEARHILFVGHGAGALVVKALLTSAMAQALEAPAGMLPQSSFTLKTRRVISTGTAAAFERPLGPLKEALGLFKRPRDDKDERAVFVRKIDAAFAEALAAFAQQGWPYPQIDELLLHSEFSADDDANEGSKASLYGPFANVRSMPPEMKAWPRAYGEIYADDLIVTPFAREISALQSTAGLRLTNKILLQFYDNPEPVRLIGQEGDLPEIEKVTTPHLQRRGTQGSIFARVYDLATNKQKRGGPNFSVVISGEAGLGKTTLMRQLAQSAAFDFFGAPAPGAPAPIFISMPTLSVEPLSIGGAAGDEFLAQTILDALLEHVSLNFEHTRDVKFATREATLRALARQATLLILDGVDEFLVNTPVVRLVHVRMAIERLLTEAGDGDLRVFIGIRNSVRNYAQLASSPNNVFLLSSLTAEQAERHFRGVSKWITKIEHAPLGQAFLTPLILSAFQEANPDVEGELTTAADLWELALRAILSKSGITKVRTAEGLSTSLDDWIVALSIVAAAFHMTLRHDFSLNELRNQTESIRTSWRTFLEAVGDVDGGGKSPLIGFDLINNERTLEALIECSVFAATARQSVQFSHRQWQDYLTARYVAMSIEFGNVDEIGRLAFNVPIYRTAGQLLTQQAVNERLIARAIERTRETRNEFIIGNLGALVGNAVAPITRPAIMRLFELLPKYTPLIQAVIIGSVGRRALQADDPSAIDIRIGIEPTLRLLANQKAGDRYNQIAESISWCFLKAYHHRFKMPPPPVNFVPFTFDSGFDDALAVVCTQADGVWTYDNKFASVQDTFTSIQELVLVDPVTRPISVAHYLACITAARIAGAQIPEVTEELGSILEQGSPFEAAFKSFDYVPEVFDLYKRCQSAYRSFAGT